MELERELGGCDGKLAGDADVKLQSCRKTNKQTNHREIVTF